MTASSKSIAAIVDEAQQLPHDDQLRFLQESCASDPQMLQSAVAELYSRTDSCQDWFDSAAGDGQEPDELQQQPLYLAGQRIGAYRVVRSLGQGGMGEVFLAERADAQFNQQVAIKLVRRGLLSRQAQGRLRLERQILATLDHPNIARLFDGGTTEDGTPYIVMEYVDGQPIDTYCDSRGLSIEARLKLFQTVCSAVHRAHQNLIVHRDLKPSNILVTTDGTPKLLDFGIAKWLDDRQMMHTIAVTQADIRVMTPDHASPEQIRGELITTASDIYVLGVLLHELLCGFKPFALRGKRLAELERAICEDDAPTPSAAIRMARDSGHSAIEQLATQRGTTPVRLQRELDGDLDNIVAMAMRKEPERRYSSVEQFSSDVERYLRGLPVLARADSWSYRAGKFIKRNGAMLGLATAFLALLIGFSITTLVQSKRVAHERDVATKERAVAEAERMHAEAVAKFLVESFELADPWRTRGDNLTAREVLDVGARRIGNELRGQPGLQATLMDTIGNVYLGLGQLDRAQPLIEQALSIRRNTFGDDSLDAGRSLLSLNLIYGARGDLAEAERLGRESLTLAEKHSGNDSLETALAVCQLGVTQRHRGKLAAAEQLFQRCMDIRIARLGKMHELVAPPLHNLAQIAMDRKDFDAAERLAREALAIDRQVRHENHPLYARHLNNLASALQGKGDLAAAGPLYRQSIELFQRVLGDMHPETIDAMSNYGRLLLREGRLDEAQSIFEAVLVTDRQVRPQHAYVGNDLESLGRVALRKRDYATAEKHLREALSIYRNTLPAGHGYIATTLTRLGRALLELQRIAEAETILDQGVQAWATAYGENSTGHALATGLRGRVWARQGRTADAERALTNSYAILAQSKVPADIESAQEIHGWIAELPKQRNQPDNTRTALTQN